MTAGCRLLLSGIPMFQHYALSSHALTCVLLKYHWYYSNIVFGAVTQERCTLLISGSLRRPQSPEPLGKTINTKCTKQVTHITLHLINNSKLPSNRQTVTQGADKSSKPPVRAKPGLPPRVDSRECELGTSASRVYGSDLERYTSGSLT